MINSHNIPNRNWIFCSRIVPGTIPEEKMTTLEEPVQADEEPSE